MASITIYVPDQDPIAIDLDGYEQISLGRGPDNDVVLEHDSLSGSHAVIQNLGGVFQVTDLGSTNGTYLNGEAISEAVLGHGSQIQFGSVEAVFVDETGEADPSAAAASDFGASSGSGYGGHIADLAEVSNRPGNFKNLSPIEKVVKKDSFALIATVLGVIAILAALAVAGVAMTMSA